METSRYFYGIALLLAAIVWVGYWHSELATKDDLVQATPVVIDAPQEQITFNIKPEDLEAESVLVVDMVRDKVLFEKNADEPRPLASLSKIVTAIVAMRNFPLDTVAITKEALSQTGEYGLREGEVWDMRELVQFMLVVSSNDAAYAIATHTDRERASPVPFIQMMNVYVGGRGLTDTYFLDSTGLDDVYGVTGYGTARDVFKLMQIAMKELPEIFHISSEARDQFISRDGYVHTAVNTNILAEEIPSLIFSKTGYTQKTGGNLVFIFEHGPHYPIGVVILGSSFNGRFEDARKIIHSFAP